MLALRLLCLALTALDYSNRSASMNIWPPSIYNRHHVQHGSAKHSVNGGLAFLWKCDFRPPLQLSPNEPIKMAFGTRDYVVETTPPAHFYPATMVCLPPGKGWNITGLSVTFFLFVFSSPRRPPKRIGRFSRSRRQMTSFRWRKCLLGVRIVWNSIWGRLPQKPL